MSLCANLKKYRKELGVTQQVLAKRAGLSFSMVSKLESGEQKNPSFSTLKKLADALEIEPSDLLHTPQTIEEQIDEYLAYKRGLCQCTESAAADKIMGAVTADKIMETVKTDKIMETVTADKITEAATPDKITEAARPDKITEAATPSKIAATTMPDKTSAVTSIDRTATAASADRTTASAPAESSGPDQKGGADIDFLRKLSAINTIPKPLDSNEDDLSNLSTRPELKRLFSVVKNATKEEIEQAIEFFEALRA